VVGALGLEIPGLPRRPGLPGRQSFRDLARQHLDERPRGGEGPVAEGGRDRDGLPFEKSPELPFMLEPMPHLAMPFDALAHLGAATAEEVDDTGPPAAGAAGALPRQARPEGLLLEPDLTALVL
jgi:hypothetical protein